MPDRNEPPERTGRSQGPSEPPDEPPIWEQIEDEPARPIAVGPGGSEEDLPSTGPASAPRGWEQPVEVADVDAFGAETAPPRRDEQVEMERPLIEAAVGVLGLAMAGLVFAPWYESSLRVTASGWSSGTWAVPVFALGVLVAVTVLLRFLRRPVSFPVHHATVIEGAGWLSVGFLFVKLFFAPKLGGAEMAVRGWLQIALLVAAAIVLLGGMVSRQAPLVLRPGWLRARGGMIGAALLLVAAGVGVAFGFLNGVTDPYAQPKLEQGLPACAREAGVPIPDGFTPTSGQPIGGGDGTTLCYANLDVNQSAERAFKQYRSLIRSTEGWTYVHVPPVQSIRQFQATHGQGCFSFNFSQLARRSTKVTVIGGETYCDLAEQLREQQRELRRQQPNRGE